MPQHTLTDVVQREIRFKTVVHRKLSSMSCRDNVNIVGKDIWTGDTIVHHYGASPGFRA